jgi:hypothetical protein
MSLSTKAVTAAEALFCDQSDPTTADDPNSL